MYQVIKCRSPYHVVTESQQVEYDAEATTPERIKALQDILLARETWEEENDKILGYINLKISPLIQQITAS